MAAGVIASGVLLRFPITSRFGWGLDLDIAVSGVGQDCDERMVEALILNSGVN